MIVRLYEASDFEVISEWLKAHWAGALLPPAALPTLGWVAEDEKGPVAAGFFYTTDSILAFLEWTTTRPKAGLSGIMGLKAVVRAAQEHASLMGLQIMQFIVNEKLVSFYENKLGFRKTERATLMIWRDSWPSEQG